MNEDEDEIQVQPVAPSQDASFLRRFAGSSNAVQKAGFGAGNSNFIPLQLTFIHPGLLRISRRSIEKLRRLLRARSSMRYLFLIAWNSAPHCYIQNEKRRDADWTERINNILARRDELMGEADIGTGICAVRKQLSNESTRT